MQPQPTTPPLTISKSGVCVVDGYGVRLLLERGRLVIQDTVGPVRREGRFVRATVPFRRLVVRGHTGFITLDALRWLSDVGIGFVQLDPDGRILATSANLGLDDPRLRRAQALAWRTPTGIGIARDLLDRKLTGQARLAGDLPAGAEVAATIQQLRAQVADSGSPEELMIVEAAAAAAYWEAWATVEIPWVRLDAARVPEYWRTVGPRSSPLTHNPRLAANPANAIFNYLYAILEAEARLACLAAGLDPGLGVLHADQKSRDSLALDVMEAGRPDVDAFVLGLLHSSMFRAADFIESRQGQVRIVPPLTHRLAETAPHWAKLLGPIVERVAKAFAESPTSRVDRLPTNLTQANRSAGRDHLRRHPRKVRGGPHGLERMLCVGCGKTVKAGQTWCDVCRPEVKLRAGLEGLAAARALRTELRIRGADPATSDSARAKRSGSLRKRRAEESAWKKGNPKAPDPDVFQREVLPLIQGVPVRRLAALTGLSVGYCALIRRGLRTPHPRWWEPMASVGLGSGTTRPSTVRG